MIQEFSVQNYRSIKGKQTLSFLANNKMKSDADDYLTVQVNDSTKLLKLGVLYGYNASGKSNLLYAMHFLSKVILKGPSKKNEEIGFTPFLLDDDFQLRPGVFSVIFFIGPIKYNYTITLDNKLIYNEILSYYPLKNKVRLFSRIYDTEAQISKVVFGKDCHLLAKEKNILIGNTLGNMSVLNAYQKTNVNSSLLNKVVGFFAHNILPIVTPHTVLKDWSFHKLEEDTSKKEFYLEFLKKADLQISDLTIKNNNIEVSDELLKNFTEHGVPQELINKMKKEKSIQAKELLFSHTTSQGVHQLKDYQESLGTQRYFGLGGILKELLNSSTFVAMDEIETSLHPELVTFFLQMFLMNAKNSQLFITTHNQAIMDQDYIRNDMIWFCEKDEEGGSNYYCAQEFKLHKNVSLSNFYRAGKLGATPFLGSPIIRDEKK